jgi:small subunit ribosomal protein S20
MAHSLSARKRVRQNEAARARNRWRLRTMRDAIKVFRDKLVHGTAEEAAEALRTCSWIVDRTAQKGVIHKNQAARRKSRMSAALKAKKTAKAA